jgi:DNA replicative helicase MCM subunit Mcm2 (Cdc46/Mcm family)
MSESNHESSSSSGNNKYRIKEIDLTPALQKCGVTRLGRDNLKILIEYNFQAKDGQWIPVAIYFDLKRDFFDTLEEFDKKASKRVGLFRDRIEKTKAALSNDEYYVKVLSYYEYDELLEQTDGVTNNSSSFTPPSIGEPTITATDDGSEEHEQEKTYASSVSDPDYTDEGLPLLSVTSAIRKDPCRLRVCGNIDTVRKPFKLLTKVYFVCRSTKCSKQDIQEPHLLDTPIFSVEDMPIAFEGGIEEYSRYQRCPACRGRRDIVQDFKKFANAKTIELKNLDRTGNRNYSAVALNNTLSMERLTVFVVGKHTLSVGFGEEVEIVGDLHVLASWALSSRVGNGGRGGAGANSGRAQPILYAKRIKYTKRERELKLTEQDVKAIKKFASLPNLLPRLVSMTSPEIYGHEDVKEGMLLVAVGAAPIQKDNWYRRHWLNAGLFGDKGTGKTTMAKDAAKLIPGSQTVSGQHSTGKGVVAIAERESDSVGGAILRAGAATLANNAICIIDEIGIMKYDDQDQFLSLMEEGHFDFNKFGIRQRIEAKTSFIVTANPMTTNWKNPDKISKDEIPLKGVLIDRLDLFFAFRAPQTLQEIEDFANNMLELSKKYFRLDFLFLRKYLYYIHSSGEFDKIDFDEPYLAERLKNFWIDLMSANPDTITNRGFESTFRIAKAFARLMFKKTVNSEVVEQTIKFIGDMYRTHGSQIGQTTDYRNYAYLGITKVVKDHSQNILWAQEQGAIGLDELDDITFNKAAEIASKDQKIRHYLGDNFRSSSNRAARHLREMFREEREYENGRITVASKDKYAELKLRWVPFHVDAEKSTAKN